jgi:predicted phage terminase large subunit-like protein
MVDAVLKAFGGEVVEDVVRGQWSPRQRRAIMHQTASLDAQRPGPPVRTVIEREGGSSGKEVAESDISLLAGFPVAVDAPTGSKEVRAQPFADQAEGGNVDIVAAAWNRAYLDEMAAFPFGSNDDQVDGSSGAFAWLSAN